MRRLLIALAALLVGAVQAAFAQPDLPLDKGLPVLVKAATAYVEMTGFDENASTFRATVDLRLRWQDLRQRRPPDEANDPPRVFRGDDARLQMKRIWIPPVEIANQAGGDNGGGDIGLRIFPDGQVELTRRVTGEFETVYDVSRFPFGEQLLQLRLVVRNLTAGQVDLTFDQDDLDYSRAAPGAALDGWDLRFVNLRVGPLPGWYGGAHATLTAALEIGRQTGPAIAAIFVPLLASLLIPILTIWLNKVEDGGFKVDAFELVNIVIGGLFAVIALNFTVNSVFEVLVTGDNPVNRLFTLNYVTLAVCLAVNVLLGRFNLAARLAGPHVQEQVYLFLMWAIPAMVLLTAASIIFVAIA
ncbi:MAG: hypothetical protein AB7S80_05195 [Rhizobiaceae bacterium]